MRFTDFIFIGTHPVALLLFTFVAEIAGGTSIVMLSRPEHTEFQSPGMPKAELKFGAD